MRPRNRIVGARLCVVLEPDAAIGPGKADILEAVRHTRSIAAAGRQLGMNYKRAWYLIETMNRCFRAPLVQAVKGGQRGGGARLTAAGQEVLRRYRRMEAQIEELAQLAERMVVLANGTVAGQGSVSQILERLDLQAMTGRFEAGVVLKAQVVGHDPSFGLSKLDHHGQSILMPILDLPRGSEVKLRIRARDVALATRRPEGLSIRNVFSGTALELVEEADTAFAEVLVDLGSTRLRARVTRQAIAELGLKPGAPVFALVKSVTFDRRALPRAAALGHAAGP